MLNVAGVAQLVEQLICNQQVIRSNRIIGSNDEKQIIELNWGGTKVAKWSGL
jgi:hypothetical protein